MIIIRQSKKRGKISISAPVSHGGIKEIKKALERWLV